LNIIETIEKEWLAWTLDMESNPFFTAINEKTFSLQHYAMFLREEYFNTFENPEALVFMATHLKGVKRKINKGFIRHALSEMGHFQLAANDLESLGYASNTLQHQRPLVTTEAFFAFSMFQVQHRNPIAFLGYVYHLEKIAVTKGRELVNYLSSIGVPIKAMSFLTEHTDVDPGHMNWNEEYIRELVLTPDDLENYLYGLRGAVKMHAVMLHGIIEAVDKGLPAWEKLNGTRIPGN
jgi:Iron-containing redox enzyme